MENLPILHKTALQVWLLKNRDTFFNRMVLKHLLGLIWLKSTVWISLTLENRYCVTSRILQTIDSRQQQNNQKQRGSILSCFFFIKTVAENGVAFWGNMFYSILLSSIFFVLLFSFYGCLFLIVLFLIKRFDRKYFIIRFRVNIDKQIDF